jgi:hypothetical protein
MRKIIRVIAVTILFTFIVVGCGIKDDTTNDGNTTNNGNTTNDGDVSDNESNSIFNAEVIETGASLLIAPEVESNEYRSSDKISVSLNDAKIVNADGQEIAKEDLNVGDIITVTYNGIILESYPAQITASNIKVVDHNILMEGYLAIIDDLYLEDEGLNSDIKMIALDTTEWIGLTDIEKEIIFSKVKDKYGYEVVEGTFEDLSEEGIIDNENLLFKDGILITLSDMKYDQKKSKITCATKKWRSGLGAVGANEVIASYDGKEWNIKKDGMWIS